MSNDRHDSLRTISDLASIANFLQLGSIKREISETQREVESIASRQRSDDLNRDFIFKVRQFLEIELQNCLDPVAKAVACVTISQGLDWNKFSSSSYSQITDKQYYSETVALLQKNLNEVSQCFSEAENIIQAYRRLTIIIPFLKDQTGYATKAIKDFSRKPFLYQFAAFICVIVAVAIVIVSPIQTQNVVIFLILFFTPIIALIVYLAFSRKYAFVRLVTQLKPLLALGGFSDEPRMVADLFGSLSKYETEAQTKIDEIEALHPELRSYRKFLWN